MSHKWIAAASASREKAVPFRHWVDLLRVDPHAASEFLNAYLATRGGEVLEELRAAQADLEREGSESSHIQGAVDQLRREIARREVRTISGRAS
ncbi:MAG: hypothetical protein ACREUU_19675 [Gammaproteobacteria bacterium]